VKGTVYYGIPLLNYDLDRPTAGVGLLAEGDRSPRRVGAIEHSGSYAFVDA
jgi:hypothetical protein